MYVKLWKTEKNSLWESASPDTSALSFYHVDGETKMICTLYDAEAEKEILHALADVSVKDYG